MRRRTKAEQREYIGPRARDLAQTGRFSGWWEIEVYLRKEENCPEARYVLDDDRIRDELDCLCKKAREHG